MPLPPIAEEMGAVLADYGAPAKPNRKPKSTKAKRLAETPAAGVQTASTVSTPVAAAAGSEQPKRRSKTSAATSVAKTPVPTSSKTAAKKRSSAASTTQHAGTPAEKKGASSSPAKTTIATQRRAKTEPENEPPLLRGAAGRRGRIVTPDDKPKLFVLDTNVLMHDPLSLFRFAEHDVYLPMTTLEELDNHKKGLTDVARNARSVSRTLDALIELNGGEIHEGVPLNLLGNTEAGGRLFFETSPIAQPIPGLPGLKGDNSILATVRGVAQAFLTHAVVLVSKDINMRIKATTLGIPAEDYFSDKILDDSDVAYTGRTVLPANFWEEVKLSLKSGTEDGIPVYAFESENPSDFHVNECLTIEGDDHFSAMITSIEGRLIRMRVLRDYRTGAKSKVWGIQARNAEQNMALNLLMDPEIDFVTILGQAGTGKTLLTLAAALAQTIDERRFSEIIVTRATVSVGEDIGFLPGTEEEKMAPWMGALDDNLEVLHKSEGAGDWGRQATMDLIKNRIRVKSMSFMRGRTFLQKFVIIDEAQNLSPKQMKTLITRAGPGTKIVCLGNLAQIDTPYLTEGSSGLTYVVERFAGWPHAATITLARGERSRLAEFASHAL